MQTRLLDARLRMGKQVTDVKTWQRTLQVQLNLRDAQTKTDE